MRGGYEVRLEVFCSWPVPETTDVTLEGERARWAERFARKNGARGARGLGVFGSMSRPSSQAFPAIGVAGMNGDEASQPLPRHPAFPSTASARCADVCEGLLSLVRRTEGLGSGFPAIGPAFAPAAAASAAPDAQAGAPAGTATSTAPSMTSGREGDNIDEMMHDGVWPSTALSPLSLMASDGGGLSPLPAELEAGGAGDGGLVARDQAVALEHSQPTAMTQQHNAAVQPAEDPMARVPGVAPAAGDAAAASAAPASTVVPMPSGAAATTGGNVLSPHERPAHASPAQAVSA